MSKLSRTVLKEIVKEVMVEILLEGLNTDSSSINENRKLIENTNRRKSNLKKTINNTNSINARRTHLDNIKFDQERSLPNMPKSDNPIMNEIFKDTAVTTLKEQAAAQGNKQPEPKDAASVMARQTELTSLFGNASSKWAQLAFADPITK